MEKFSKIKHYAITGLLVVVFFLSGIYIGTNNQPAIAKVSTIVGKESTDTSVTADFAPFWKVWNMIDQKYPTASETTDQERVYGAIAGLVSSLNDPYSVFMAPEESKSFEEEISGNFTGIGMEVGIKDKVLTVIAPLKGTPAERAGIEAGDKIIKIDDKLTAGLSVEESVKLIKGEKGSSVTLTIIRGTNAPKEIKIVRDVINIPTLDTELRQDGIFVIKLYSFSAKSPSLFRKAINEFAKSGSNKLIIDLRGNPGGYLNAAVDIASWFLPGGKVVVTENYGGKQPEEVFRSKGYDIFTDKLKLVILIDDGSASASEILAGALHDYNKATLVGTKSFGKGSVQEVIDITKDTILKITVANWLTPNGNSISEKGLTPDYIVEITDKDAAAKKDTQMDKAVEILLKK